MKIGQVISVMASNEEIVRQQILGTHFENPNASHRWIGKQLGIAHSTVSHVINTFKDRKTTKRKNGSGKKRGTSNPEKARMVLNQFKRYPNISIRDVAKKAKVSVCFVQKTMKRSGLHVYKVQKAPNRSDKQNSVAKTRARKLYREWLTKPFCIVMDDETYIKADTKQMPGQEHYVATSKLAVPESVRKKKLSKFAKKFLVWQAICGCGKMSQPFITSGTVNGQIYKDECLQKRLLPFLRSHDGPTLFWPDLASCHYARPVLDWYKDNNVVFVPKDVNPPNTPELRPIEKFWAIMKAKLVKTPKLIKNELELKKVWLKVSKQVGPIIAQNLMKGVKAKVRAFGLGEEVQ